MHKITIPLSVIRQIPLISPLDVSNKNGTIVELACCFDLYMDICFNTKLLKYQPLANSIINLGFNCTLMVLTFGSLGHVHKLVLRGLQRCGPKSKKTCKVLLHLCHNRQFGHLEKMMQCVSMIKMCISIRRSLFDQTCLVLQCFHQCLDQLYLPTCYDPNKSIKLCVCVCA